MSAPIFGIRPGAAQITLTNSTDPNFRYVVQISTNLKEWVSVTTNFATGPDSPVTVPAPDTTCFYQLVQIPRVEVVPVFRYAILTSSNFNAGGNNFTVDSFDSRNPLYSTFGQYNVLLRKAGGNVATDALFGGDLSVGNGNIYGHLYTGIGTTVDLVQIGTYGAVGSASWNTTNVGIQSGYWSGNFYINFPDVTGPTEGTNSLPAASNGVVTLNGGTYVVPPTDPGLSARLLVTAPTTLWVQGSYTVAGITFTNIGTSFGSLMLYVGRASGSGDSLGFTTNVVNQPGFAFNFQVYGLPSLASVALTNNNGFVGAIYAPKADAVIANSGDHITDFSGAVVTKSVTLKGDFNFHFDENLEVHGPYF